MTRATRAGVGASWLRSDDSQENGAAEPAAQGAQRHERVKHEHAAIALEVRRLEYRDPDKAEENAEGGADQAAERQPEHRQTAYSHRLDRPLDAGNTRCSAASQRMHKGALTSELIG